MSPAARLVLIFFLFIVLAVCVTQASAHIFVIGDQDDGFTVAFPEEWTPVTNQKPDDKLTIAAPGGDDVASCRVRVREDRRFMTYPPSAAATIQNAAYGKDFWSTYLNEYDRPALSSVTTGARMGQVPATQASAFYVTPREGIEKQAVMNAALYNGRAYIVECAAEADSFSRFSGAFTDIMNSLNPTKVGNGLRQSYYSDFTNDPMLIINRGGGDAALYY